MLITSPPPVGFVVCGVNGLGSWSLVLINYTTYPLPICILYRNKTVHYLNYISGLHVCDQSQYESSQVNSGALSNFKNESDG